MARRLRGDRRTASSGNSVVDLAAVLVRDPLGLSLILGIPLLCLALFLVSLLGHRLPPPVVPPKPVEVTVNLQPEVRELPPSRVVPAPKVVPLPKPQKVARPAPVPKPHPIQVARVAPAPVSKKIVRPAPSRPKAAAIVRQPAPKEIRIPAPSPTAPVRTERAVNSSPIPSARRTRVGSRSEADLPVVPRASRFAETPRPEVGDLQQTKATFGAAAPRTDLAVHPALNRAPSRASAGESLPVDKAVTLNRRSAPELNLPATGLTGIHYPKARASTSPAGLPVRRESVVSASQGDESILPPPSPGAGPKRRERTENASLPGPSGQEVAFAARESRSALDLPSASSASVSRRNGRKTSTAPALPQGGTSSVAFAGDGPEQALNLPAATVGSGGGPVTASAQPAAVPGKSYDFLDSMAPGDLDPSVKTRLNNLHTCLDPEAEMNLKSRMAGLLSRPALCRSGGVVFDIGSPESAYSIQIDLYNYEKRDFPDKCAALKSALEACEARRLNR